MVKDTVINAKRKFPTKRENISVLGNVGNSGAKTTNPYTEVTDQSKNYKIDYSKLKKRGLAGKKHLVTLPEWLTLLLWQNKLD